MSVKIYENLFSWIYLILTGSCLEVSDGKLNRYNCSGFLLGCPDARFHYENAYECKKQVFGYFRKSLVMCDSMFWFRSRLTY